jgi:cathepsin L
MAAAKFASLLLFVISQAKASSPRTGLSSGLAQPSFSDFIAAHGRTYQPGSDEYAQRLALFEKRVAEVQEHNAVPGQLWAKGINKLADRTDSELAALRGYRRQARAGGREARQPFELMGWEASRGHPSSRLMELPADFSWKHSLHAMQEIEDQGGCGSCWAFAASTVLRAHSQLFQSDRKFSQQQIVACTPNPEECGGQGGCRGATIELAMDYVAQNGCVTAHELPYTESDNTCPASMIQDGGDSSSASGPHSGGGLAFGMTGYHKLPENELQPLLLALTERGPIGVSIATSSGWNSYSHGIIAGCPRDVVIDHAVTLVGYGQDGGVKYWQIQNSWGPDWGEGGFIRMMRHAHDEEAAYCGVDNQPEVGSGCRGGPPKVNVCGSCGILYDTVVPTFQLSTTGWWSTRGNHTPIMLEQTASTRRLLRVKAHAPGQ